MDVRVSIGKGVKIQNLPREEVAEMNKLTMVLVLDYCVTGSGERERDESNI